MIDCMILFDIFNHMEEGNMFRVKNICEEGEGGGETIMVTEGGDSKGGVHAGVGFRTVSERESGLVEVLIGGKSMNAGDAAVCRAALNILRCADSFHQKFLAVSIAHASVSLHT